MERRAEIEKHSGRATALCEAAYVIKGGVRAEIAQLFNFIPLFKPFIILILYLQHMESLTEITSRQSISERKSPFMEKNLSAVLSPLDALQS